LLQTTLRMGWLSAISASGVLGAVTESKIHLAIEIKCCSSCLCVSLDIVQSVPSKSVSGACVRQNNGYTFYLADNSWWWWLEWSVCVCYRGCWTQLVVRNVSSVLTCPSTSRKTVSSTCYRVSHSPPVGPPNDMIINRVFSSSAHRLQCALCYVIHWLRDCFCSVIVHPTSVITLSVQMSMSMPVITLGFININI